MIKSWLKKNLPFTVKLALKRALNPLRRQANVPSFSFETPQLSEDGRVNFDLVRRFLNNATPPSRLEDDPVKVSIVIPVFNKAEFTFQCLRSLIDEIDFNEHEVIVVNNASTDETNQLLDLFSKFIVVIDNQENHGFVDACNQGAAQASGRFLLFLNNDTVVLPRWLDELLETVAADERIGVAGSLFLYPNGAIQEAGSIVWNDGHAFHYGWGHSPDDPRFVFARDVDYCSGASLLIRKDLFDRIGGFDRRYAPAYYEDADLCFAARAAGYRVVFQPASKIIHYEGATAGQDQSKGFKNYQQTNQPKFYEKWKSVLQTEHLANEERNIERAARRLPRESVVVFDDLIPTPDLDAGSARMLLILKLLAKHYRTVFVYKARNESPEYERMVWKVGVETCNLIHYPKLLKERTFKTAIVSRPELAEAVVKSIRRRAKKTKIVFDTVDAHFLRLALEFELNKDPKTKQESERYRKIELAAIEASDVIWFTSPIDKDAFAVELTGKQTAIIPTIHELKSKGKPFAGRRDLLFIGNFNHRPNADAVVYLAEEVLPRVRETLPDVKVHVVGSNAPVEFEKYSSVGVQLHGYVPDIEPLFSSCRVFVAPLRFGAGVKGKLGDALSYGIPIVTTDVGASGMSFQNETNALIANTKEEFADAVVKLYQDSSLWQRLSDNGREHIKRHFSPEVLEEVIMASIA
jgi:GT2 family glycosyltransferase